MSRFKLNDFIGDRKAVLMKKEKLDKRKIN